MSGEVPEVRPIEDKTTYSVFQTSIAKLQTTRWRVNMNWQRHTADQAKEFLKGAPVRDKRALSEKGIFRMLFVHLPDSDRATLREDLIEAAVAYGWADSQLSCRLRSKTGGLLWSHTRDGARSGTCFVAQTPVADNNLTYYLSLTEVTHTYNAQSDWVCLFIGTNEASPERIASLVARDPFPSDFLPPLSPDFAFFPVCILSYDVSELAKGVDELNRRILDQAAYLAQTDDAAMEEGDDASGKPGGDVEMRLVDSYRPVTPDLRRIRASRSALLAVQQQHLMLKRRWAFLNDFTQTLVVYFGLREASMSNEGDPAFYSSTLRKKVDRELANLASLSHELRSIPLRIEAQQTSVDNYTSLLIASNSQVTASQSLLESKVMRMIAVLTFVFLPGTFVAALFSMSMFHWDADETTGERVVSKYIWIYVVATLSLTFLAMILGWLVWIWQKRYPPSHDVETPRR